MNLHIVGYSEAMWQTTTEETWAILEGADRDAEGLGPMEHDIAALERWRANLHDRFAGYFVPEYINGAIDDAVAFVRSQGGADRLVVAW